MFRWFDIDVLKCPIDLISICVTIPGWFDIDLCYNPRWFYINLLFNVLLILYRFVLKCPVDFISICFKMSVWFYYVILSRFAFQCPVDFILRFFNVPLILYWDFFNVPLILYRFVFKCPVDLNGFGHLDPWLPTAWIHLNWDAQNTVQCHCRSDAQSTFVIYLLYLARCGWCLLHHACQDIQCTEIKTVFWNRYKIKSAFHSEIFNLKSLRYFLLLNSI